MRTRRRRGMLMFAKVMKCWNSCLTSGVILMIIAVPEGATSVAPVQSMTPSPDAFPAGYGGMWQSRRSAADPSRIDRLV
jgi:hypothetical protein